jgi:L-aspartate oxidase
MSAGKGRNRGGSLSHHSDYLVVGSGIAGLSFALRAAETGSVTILTKKARMDSNTNHAQGGIAAVVDSKDSFALHIGDTLMAGVGLNRPRAVELIVNESPESVRELEKWGVSFTRKDEGVLDLGREGGHSMNRIVHVKDSTGMAMEQALLDRVRNHPRIRILEEHVGVEIITEHHLTGRRRVPGEKTHCWGVYALDQQKNEVVAYLAGATLLATGGVGRVYLHTTNPSIATGDGVAMAYRAGAMTADLEFMQFHPTALFHPEGDSFLISEAVRGFGGILRAGDGEAFMKRYHPMADLAPRDVVARAIDAELKKSGDDCVFLDVTHLDPDSIRSHFPHIHEKLLSLKIDMTREMIPVVPAAHYMCGGVLTDLEGRSTIEGLYVTGEAACTGVHGANRLASNSLLEAVVFSKRAFLSAVRYLETSPKKPPEIPGWNVEGTFDQEEWVLISHDQREIRRLMWDYVGIVRSDERLERANRRIQLIADEIEEFYKKTKVTAALLELRNISCVALLIIRCALFRKESRGLHYTTDYPNRDDVRWLGDTVIQENRTFFWPLAQELRF